MRLRRQSDFSNNNLGIEEAPQLQDELGPGRIDQSPGGRIIASVRMFGSALLLARHGFMWGSARLIQAWFHSAQPWFGTLVGLGWQLNICIGAGLATLTNQGLANHGPPFLEPKCCFDAFSMGGERVPILFIKTWSEPLEPLYQPKARYKNRPDSKLGSVRLEIAARLKAHFSA